MSDVTSAPDTLLTEEPCVAAIDAPPARPSFKHPRDSWDEEQPSAIRLCIGDHQLFPWPDTMLVQPLQRINRDTAWKVVRAVREALGMPMPCAGSTLSVLCYAEGTSVHVDVHHAEIKADIVRLAYRAVRKGDALAVSCQSLDTGLRYDPHGEGPKQGPSVATLMPRPILVRAWEVAMRAVTRVPGDETRLNEIDYLLRSDCEIMVGSPVEMCKYR